MLTTIAIIIFLVILAILVFKLGGITERFFPREILQVGSSVEIFCDGVYNRTATITGITTDKIYIYDTLPLPLDYRGKFYGVGCDSDGVEFWYLKDRRRNRLLVFAEFIRTKYITLNDPYNFEPVTSESDLLTAAQKQKTESEQMRQESTSDKEEIE